MERRLIVLIAALIPAMVAVWLGVATATHAGEQRSPTVTVRDRAGDPEDGNYKRYPGRRDLDIRFVQVRKLPRSLRVVIQTAARVRAGTIYSLFYYHGLGGERGGLVQVRYRFDRSVGADANIEPSPVPRQLPRGSARFVGTRLVLDVPNRYLDIAPIFNWRVATGTIGAAVEISDDVPNQPRGFPLQVKLAGYP